MQIYAGAQSVPVIWQALCILASQQIPTMNDENIDMVPPEAIVLAAVMPDAKLPGRFLRLLPDTLEARLRDHEKRNFGIPTSVLEIPKLVLVRPSRDSLDGCYEGEALLDFRASLLGLAGIVMPKRQRNRGRRAHSRGDLGTPPYLTH